jgi:1,2-phenylacetyl-CoA epoxidase catalytic subunit
MENVELRVATIKKIVDMLNNCSKYVELCEYFGVNNNSEELKELRKEINYYELDDMVDYLLEMIGDEK